MENKLEKKMIDCPVTFDWCKYKGTTFFASLNYEKSIQQNRVMIDLHYCATKALNDIVEMTVPYSPKNFKVTNP